MLSMRILRKKLKFVKSFYFYNMTNEDQENILKDFISKITDDVQDVPPEILEAVDEHFFDLL